MMMIIVITVELYVRRYRTKDMQKHLNPVFIHWLINLTLTGSALF